MNELRDTLGRWLFELQEVMRSLASPEDADWGEWVERNREEWRRVADDLLSMPLAELCAKAAAADRVCELLATSPTRHHHVSKIRAALDGTPAKEEQR